MQRLNLDRQNLRKFGITMGIILLLITLLIFIRHRHSIFPTAIISAIFFILAVVAPLLLKPIYIVWMKLAFILSWINTRIILFVIFYLLFTPIGLGLRLFRLDLLDRKINKGIKSYWKEKKGKIFNPFDYERLF